MQCSSSFESRPKFWRNKLCLPPAFTLVSCSAYSSTLKIEATSSSETSADFQRTTCRYIPEYRTVTLPIPTADQKLIITLNSSAWILVSQKEHGDPREAHAPSRYGHCKRQRSHRVRRSIPRMECHLVTWRAVRQQIMDIKLG
jgi:hypothetical protein